MSASSTNVALPALSRSFGASFTEVQWIVLANLLATTTLVVSAGRLGDAVGRRRMLAGGILLFSVASIACAMANALWLLVAARALQGIGSAAMMAMSMTLATEAAPPGKAGRVLGTLGTMSAAGTALGPSL
jgi:MFS family permease